MQLVLLCGGLGTRLKSISGGIPKSLVQINKKPFIDYLISSVMKYNPSSIHFCLGMKSDLYLEYMNKAKIPTKISFSIEKENKLLGTGGAIKNAIDSLESNFIIQYGDSILDFDYNKFYESHVKNKKEMSMTILPSNLTSESPNMLCNKHKNGKDISCIYDKFNI